MSGGKVYLVGAGPGDPELLTRKAWRVLQTADVVLHDDLVSAEILALLPTTARVISVGKRCGAKNISQAEVNERMVAFARAGQTVVRLKNGDPMLFGRASEEITALREAGVEFEVVPGVTAALGAAASAQVPLTDRRHASRVVFFTAHRAEDAASSAGEAGATYVIYMPGSRYEAVADELAALGVATETPCLLISRATLPDEAIYRTTVEHLARTAIAAAPSLIIVGEVAAAFIRDTNQAARPSSEILDLVLHHTSEEG